MNSTYGNSIGTLRKGGVTVAIVAAAFALAVALGMAAPAQAVAAQGSNELAAGSAQVATQGDFAMANPEWTSIWAGDTAYTGLYQYTNGITDGIQITKVTSSNSAVLKVKKLDSYKQLSSYEVYPLKAGKAKLSVTYKQNGATKTISETYTVKTFTNGFKSIKLNGESLTVPTSKKADSSGRYYCFTGTSAKVNVTTANG